MKTAFNAKDIFLVVILSAILLFVFSLPAKSQDKKQDSPQKAKIIVKINKGDKSNTRVIDTTFNLSNPADQKEFQEYIKKIEGDADKMKEKVENMEITVNIPDMPDSLDSDSILTRVICLGKEGKAMHDCMKSCPGAFDFKFDMPCDPDEMMPPGCCDKFFYFNDGNDFDQRSMEFGDKEETLGDIIGDIPMDRVTSYKIKDKKNGKRIIIDIEDAPLMDRNIHKKVIIVGEPGNGNQHYYHNSPKHNVEKKVIIKSGSEEGGKE